MAKVRKTAIHGAFTVTNGTYVVAVVQHPGIIEVFRTAINAAITTNDATVTPKINGVAITGGAVTIANASSAQGDVDTAASLAGKVKAGDVLSVTVAGTPGGSAAAVCGFSVVPA